MEILSIRTSRGHFYEVVDPFAVQGYEDLDKERVLEIIEHAPGGPGDSLYYDILYDIEIDSSRKRRIRRIFDPVEVISGEENG